VPRISAFFGIAIYMYFSDHAPPHFHAIYGEQEAEITIESLEVIRGGLSRRALALVLEWASAHRAELRANWARARAHESLQPIAPLE
jgi:hypothetical protein